MQFADEIAGQARRDGAGTAAFALFWSLIVGIVCVVVIVGTARQVASAYRPTADGIITVSEAAGRRASGWKLAYRYTVAGQPYTGAVYAYDPMPIGGAEEVRRHVAAYSVGGAVVVYYDADDPADAVLRPVDGFLLDPPVAVPASIWGAVLTGSALATWRMVRTSPVLTVDSVGGAFQFAPAGFQGVEMPLSAIDGVSVTRQMYRRKNRQYARYRVELARSDGDAALAVAEYDDSRDARALADWLLQHGVGGCEAGRREASP